MEKKILNSNNMKVIFVGLHNKPGKMPLCSSTKSGKLIDRVIKEGGFTNWQKTNLFDVDYFPVKDIEQAKLAYEWGQRIDPDDNDILVLLGQAVHLSWQQTIDRRYNVLFVAHPASKRSHEEMNEYVKATSFKIQSLLNQTT